MRLKRRHLEALRMIEARGAIAVRLLAPRRIRRAVGALLRKQLIEDFLLPKSRAQVVELTPAGLTRLTRRRPKRPQFFRTFRDVSRREKNVLLRLFGPDFLRLAKANAIVRLGGRTPASTLLVVDSPGGAV